MRRQFRFLLFILFVNCFCSSVKTELFVSLLIPAAVYKLWLMSKWYKAIPVEPNDQDLKAANAFIDV